MRETTRTTVPVHIQAMSTPLVAPIRYWAPVRFYDSWWIGRRDADPALAHAPYGEEQPSASLRTLEAVFRERAERERMSAVRKAAQLIDRRAALVLAEDPLQQQIEDLGAEVDERNTSNPEALAHIAKTEAHLDPAQREGRRRREAAARVAPLIAQREAARRELTAKRLERADIEAQLGTLYESLRARVNALAHYYERRCNTLVRGYLRRAPGDAQHPLNARTPLRLPAWATEPNPWLTGIADEEVQR